MSRSDWKSIGSEMKSKSGFYVEHMSWRSLDTLLNPSQFQVIHLNGLCTGASEMVSDLSEASSLNEDCQRSH